MRVEGHRRRRPEIGDGGQRSMKVPTGLGVNDDHLAPGLDETGNQMIRLLDHEMSLERHVHRRAYGGNDVGAERQIGDEASVHDIELDPIDARLLQGLAFLTETSEVGGKDGGDDEGRARHGIGCGHSLFIMPEFEVELDRVATGGACIGRGPDGRVVFVDGALPKERVLVEPTVEYPRRIEARLLSVLQASAGRREAPCRHVADGCGGCDWQHAEPQTQSELRRDVVVDCLRRLARIDDPDVRLGPQLNPDGYRTSVRVAVVDGKAGYRAAGSHRVVPVDRCLIAHPLVDEILVEGRFGDATEATIRVGSRTGERLVIVAPTATDVRVPDDVLIVGQDDLARGRSVHYHEEILGRRLRISASSFFQCRADGAETLVELARQAIADVDGPLLDAYCGVGLFGALLGSGRSVTGIESARSSFQDAKVNYGDDATVVKTNVERWRPSPMGAVIADPARSGLGKRAVERLASTDATVIALVSCDPASLARDAGLLRGHGYDLESVTTVDLFAQTSHVETVSRFVKR